MTHRLDITPLTRIGVLLDAYPELEEVLIELAPAFRKLRNPVLRRTVAKIATVQKAASMGGIDVREMVAALRRAAGQDPADAAASGSAAEGTDRWERRPAWMDESRVEVTIDADALLEAGEVPLGRVVQAARGLGDEEILRVTSAFRPVPLLEALEKQRFRVFLREAGAGRFETFVSAGT